MWQLQALRNASFPKGIEVDLEALAAIADTHAFEVWGDEIARGEPVPVTDAVGDVRAYVFPYARRTRTFPTDALLTDHEANSNTLFGGVYVAVQPTNHPVLRVVDSLPPLFLHAEQAQAVGRSVLAAPDASLTRIYWLGGPEYFEITARGRRLLLDVHTMAQVEPEEALKPNAATGGTNEMAGLGAPIQPPPAAFELEAKALRPTLKLVPLAECVPVVDWTYWCVPTAWTMAVCYYDNYVKGVGGISGYGRLVGYWFEHKSGHNVPDFIDQLIDPNSGPPPSWRKGFADFSDFIKKTFGYSFSTRAVEAAANNDWAWADITAEVDAGRPFVWGVPNHATCAFGYRIASDGSKRVVIHTTWGNTSQSQREEWLYTQGTGLTAITAGDPTNGQNLVLWEPDGGQTLLANVATTIRWQIEGDRIKIADVSVSTDGGNTWADISRVPCKPGWNGCAWTPSTVTNRARVRVRGYAMPGHYIAGDGSHSNLKVLPREVTMKTVLLNAKTDGRGRFSTSHGLRGDAIHAISVAVLHKNGNWHTLEFSNSVDNRFWWNGNAVEGIIASPNFFERPVQIVVFAE